MLVRQVCSSSEDIRILGVRYVLEILERKDNDLVRQVLTKQNNLRLIYCSLLELKHKSDSQKNIEFGILCAKVVAAIGLCHNFAHDPVKLKATN